MKKAKRTKKTKNPVSDRVGGLRPVLARLPSPQRSLKSSSSATGRVAEIRSDASQSAAPSGAPPSDALLSAIASARRKAQILENRLNETRRALHSLNKKIFPLEKPEIPHFLISCKTRPASVGVSGDVFDILSLRDSMSFGFFLAGGDSYFLASKIQSALYAPASPLKKRRPATEEILKFLFHNMSSSFLKEEKARAFFGIINRRDLRFNYSFFGPISAWLKPLNGPARPLCLKNEDRSCPSGSASPAKKPDLVLSGQKLLQPGDLTALCSPGLSERINSKGDFLGDRPLLGILNGERGADPLSLRQKLLFEAESFAEGAPSRQDQTVMIIGVKKQILKLAS